ncbi:hypothetical protein EPA93_46640 [Ktedonosporobacter rubrisoli]|uniref:Gluconate 2-dehydrogenase subunit 3 family protein n=1 Tax=Ktedonosporobacter rubrisoli TaxID=2509675 RepID=A0A4P6K433_KTERU|nr:hypothetical protein [Ktedonosporobacter rubrisoli]QBD83047.1 hypothetical protein EPA93_46640 [Ktedonosporobacter rubrisoli]
MNQILQKKPVSRKPRIELSPEERKELNTIIDLLIPADENFPPPSSLHLLDEFLYHLHPRADNKLALILNEKRLRAVLRDLNVAAGGSFCQARQEEQQELLRNLECRDLAFFQELWALANHSYYTRLATWHSSTPTILNTSIPT